MGFGSLTSGVGSAASDPYFHNFLSSEPLTLGHDHFDFDVSTDIMPDLDSLLSNEDISDLS
jgi:hypothetical protein